MNSTKTVILAGVLQLIFLVSVGTQCGFAKNLDNTKLVTSLRARFKAAKSEREKVLVTLDAIDHKLIETGRSVQTVDKIFGTSLLSSLPARGDLESKSINFLPPVDSPTSATGAFPGWYLWIKFDCQGNIVNYHLSNVDK